MNSLLTYWGMNKMHLAGDKLLSDTQDTKCHLESLGHIKLKQS